MRGTRPLKRWRYIGVFADQLMVCAALVQVGPTRQSFWALLDRTSGELRERTRLLPRPGEVQLEHADAAGRGRLWIADRGIELDLVLEEQEGITALCPHGRYAVWTRKQAGVAAHGTLSVDGGPARPVAGRAVIDDTAGHHARVTEWFWSAGVGEGVDGVRVGWNLVSGVNDPPSGSERAVWVDGIPREVPAVAFGEDLTRVSCAEGSRLCFHAEAERCRRERLLIVSSEYRAPFGTFSGTLPGGLELRSGLGVMEHHCARW